MHTADTGIYECQVSSIIISIVNFLEFSHKILCVYNCVYNILWTLSIINLLEFSNKIYCVNICVWHCVYNVFTIVFDIVIKVSAQHKISRMLTLKVLQPKVNFQQNQWPGGNSRNKDPFLQFWFHCFVWFISFIKFCVIFL